MIHTPGTFNAARLVKVCYVYPEGHQFDGLFLDTGEFARCIQMASPYAGTDFGFASGIPSPEEEGYDENRDTNPDRRDIIAVVMPIATGYVGVGYLYPQVNHLAFTKGQDKNRMIQRHTSDWYQTVDDDGNMDIVHPSLAAAMPTTFIRMGVGLLPAVLTGRDYDNRFALKRNLFQPAMITIASPFGVVIAGGKETVAVGASTMSAASAAAPSGGAMLMSSDVPAVDWIADAALADTPPECVDEDQNGVCDDLDRLRERHAIVLHVGSRGCSARGKHGRMDMTVDELKTSFVFRTKTAAFSVNDDRISAYIGGSSGITIEPGRIVLQVGDTKLEITADGINTTGDMNTVGVHTDNNGTHSES